MKRLCLLLAVIAAAVAQGAEAEVKSKGLTVRAFEISPPETGLLKCLRLSFEEQTYSLVNPRQWQTESGDSIVRFRARNDNASILITFTKVPVTQTNVDLEAIIRAEVGERDLTKIHEFEQPTGIGGGKGADFSWQIVGVAMRVRCVAVRNGQTVASFLLVSPCTSFDGRQQEFGALLGSFQPAAPPEGTR